MSSLLYCWSDFDPREEGDSTFDEYLLSKWEQEKLSMFLEKIENER